MNYKLLVIHKDDEKIEDMMHPYQEISEAFTPLDELKKDRRVIFDTKENRWVNPDGKWDGYYLGSSPAFRMKENTSCFRGDPTIRSMSKRREFCQSAKVSDINPESLKEFVSDAVLYDKWYDATKIFPTSESRDKGYYDMFLRGLRPDRILTVLDVHT